MVGLLPSLSLLVSLFLATRPHVRKHMHRLYRPAVGSGKTVNTYARTMNPTWNPPALVFLFVAGEMLFVPPMVTVALAREQPRFSLSLFFSLPLFSFSVFLSLSLQLSSVRPWRLTNPGRARIVSSGGLYSQGRTKGTVRIEISMFRVSERFQEDDDQWIVTWTIEKKL